MKFYIVDDEIGIAKALENIVEVRGLGEVIGLNQDPVDAVKEIINLNPDVVLVDLLMSKMDGITLVNKVKTVKSQISFVMISKVSDKEMIAQAYNAGVEFFINKPINVIEVEKVLKNVIDKINMNNIVTNIKGMFSQDEIKPQVPKRDFSPLNIFLGMLGMTGEKGTADIIGICKSLIEQNQSYSKEALIEYSKSSGDTDKNIEQRMRRAMKKGLSNVASLGIEDYGCETFQVYGAYVFDFKALKDEMDYIKKKAPAGGRVNISKFVDGLILYWKSLE